MDTIIADSDGSGAASRGEAVVVGAGPAGLFASECLLEKGFSVSLYDCMPSPGCKLLMAGSHGGLNITNDAPPKEFATRYGANGGLFSRLLEDFSPADLKEWLASLGVAVHVGSGGKVFPEGVRTPELLARWMSRLNEYPGFSFFPEHRLVEIGPDHSLRFRSPSGDVMRVGKVAIFALGGASWPATGSDGSWRDFFRACGIVVDPFRPANCGFEADWPDYLKRKFLGLPLKNVTMTACGKTAYGELILTPYGLEGGIVYSLGADIRDEISRSISCTVLLDLLPAWDEKKIEARLASGPGKETLSNFYRKRIGVQGAAFLLLRECAARPEALRESKEAARWIKRLPVTLYRSRPIEEAISSAGGVRFDGLDESLMLKNFPGWFCAGEMLDWEAPTGGFLIQGCFSTAYRAALGAAAWHIEH